MRYRWMLLGVFVLLRTSGCQQHLFTDYRPLDQAGMWSSNVEELKKLNTSDTEVAQLVKAKQAGLSDDACVTLVNDAHQRQCRGAAASRTFRSGRRNDFAPAVEGAAHAGQRANRPPEKYRAHRKTNPRTHQ